MAPRTFTCKECSRPFAVDAPGRFTRCPECKEALDLKKRTKVCDYRHCNETFIDKSKKNIQKFCPGTDHGRREKMFRLGKAKDESYFRDSRPKKPGTLCLRCNSRFVQVPGEKNTRCKACRDELRQKTCRTCGNPFKDESLKNTRKDCVPCSQPKPRTPSFSDPAKLKRRRKVSVLSGGSRIDDLSTLRKGTPTWWGRVAELIYAELHPRARDMVAQNGSGFPFDFLHPFHGRVDVKGGQIRKGRSGRSMWSYPVSGLKDSCDTAFLVGFNNDRVERLWLYPSKDLNDNLVSLSPESSKYRGGPYELPSVSSYRTANRVLSDALANPDRNPQPGSSRDWYLDPQNLTDSSPGRGRRAELLYQDRYPLSEDMNYTQGPHHPFDFLDPDGVRVDVKSSKKKYRGKRAKWSFSILAPGQKGRGHVCDVYSCLALSEDGSEIEHEFRIPFLAIGERRVIHISDNFSRSQWGKYLVG